MKGWNHLSQPLSAWPAAYPNWPARLGYPPRPSTFGGRGRANCPPATAPLSNA
nr:MAG TPA: hypothetical protein [Caudoviricetes sp.]